MPVGCVFHSVKLLDEWRARVQGQQGEVCLIIVPGVKGSCTKMYTSHILLFFRLFPREVFFFNYLQYTAAHDCDTMMLPLHSQLSEDNKKSALRPAPNGW